MKPVPSLPVILANATDKPSANIVALLNVSLISVLLINNSIVAYFLTL